MEYDNLFDEVYIKIFNRVRDSITRAWRTYEKGDKEDYRNDNLLNTIYLDIPHL